MGIIDPKHLHFAVAALFFLIAPSAIICALWGGVAAFIVLGITNLIKHFRKTAKGRQARGAKATAALILGIIGMFIWIIPLIGLPVSITGMILCTNGKYAILTRKTLIAMVLCLVGCTLGLAYSILGTLAKRYSR